jgi:LuxR family maltose regulon positive regulatory protein
LETANLFVNPLDDERRWYRYHHLFSDLLRSQLTRSQPQLIPDLHRRASRWFVENGDIGAAIDHAFQARDLTLAAHLIEKYALRRLYRGEVTLVLSWFDHLPEAILHTSPMLGISKAWALALMQRGNRQAEVEQTLRVAENTLDEVSASESLRNLVTGYAASIRAFIMQRSSLGGENPEALVALSQKAQQLLPLEEKAIRSVNELKIGYGYLVLADLEAARRAYQNALEDGLAGGNLYAAIYGPINLVLIEYLVGHLQEALDLCERSIEKFNKLRAGQNFSPIGALYTLRGIILLEYNQLEESDRIKRWS